ncbi:D-alanyl-D-alanine carboxypeptidase [Phragmitibacter flavus]|uniref:D-alanyl-D-alanine carboxypeptidase n=1 Tax=Phragmitibacter flavus TaxID=2576071 RepID=A0A5R8KA06_9BACT|nr:D-alanyl-D-alanine carboxypeptidase family protein [Phragmitibacter flavus]TLD69153.1 D-alanyl-D-alanine carboxypeptidase [Phragmitibacter flavus]
MKRIVLKFFPLALLTLLTTQCAQTKPQRSSPYGNTSYLQQPGGLFQPASPYAPQPPAQSPAAPPFTPNPYRPFTGPSNYATDAPPIRAASYILVDANNGKVLAARNADAIRGPASTQKILTALIVAEAGNLDKPVRVAASDCAVEPSKMGVRAGESYTRRQMLIAFLVRSCNDLSNTLARDNAGSTYAFAQKMTARARALGATSSSFANAHGLTASGQYSTARDMARVAAVAYRNPIIRDAIRRRSYTFRFNSGRVVTLKNTNDLLTRMPECNGMKTGYTNAAGRCLISTASRGGRDVILVQLGTKTSFIWDDGASLMRWGLNQ